MTAILQPYLLRNDNTMFCVSISHRLADISIRERLAFTDIEKTNFTISVSTYTNIIILSTCNRTELYSDRGDTKYILDKLCDFKDISLAELKNYVNIYEGDKGIKHLYRVACGIDSMLLGEDEILGQVKDAYYFANGIRDVGYELHTIFRGAITCAKKIKTDTRISKTSVSVGTLVGNMLAERGVKNVLVIGIRGKIGEISAKNIASHGIKVIGTSRMHSADKAMGHSSFDTVPYSERYAYIDKVDGVVSATSSPHYTLTYSRIIKHTDKPKIYIDLAVPRDIDEDIVNIDGSELYNIDHFKELAENNNKIKLREADRAELIIEEMTDNVIKELYFHSILKDMGNIRSNMEALGYERIIYKARDNMSFKEFKKFMDIFSKEK